MIGNRLCWNCEGQVHAQAVRCPFCGADLSSHQEGVATTAPYQSSCNHEEQVQVPEPPYAAAEAPIEPTNEEWKTAVNQGGQQKLQEHLQERVSGVFLPLFLLSLGGIFLLFTFVLLVFSHDGFLTLQWKASSWLFYLLLSLPSIYFGWRALSKVVEEEA
ncbi:MAG: hypothetical protein ACQEP8_01600 [Chlamydiota bacterium]